MGEGDVSIRGFRTTACGAVDAPTPRAITRVVGLCVWFARLLVVEFNYFIKCEYKHTHTQQPGLWAEQYNGRECTFSSEGVYVLIVCGTLLPHGRLLFIPLNS
jgi:hypothetical protein